MIHKKWVRTEAFKYTLYGALFGCCFPIIGTLFDLLRLDLAISLTNVMKVQLNNPIHFIINTAPLFLGLVAFIAGRKQDIVVKRNQELVRASKVKEEFFANMSHEITTPLNGVVGMVNLLKTQTKTNEIQKNYIEIIENSVSDLINIINDILDASILDTNEIQIHCVPNVLVDILQLEIKVYEKSAQKKQVVIQLEVDDDIPTVLEFDETRLRQIVGNLLSNAVKFAEKGAIKVKASIQELSGSTYDIKIEIIDDGCGIAEQHQELIFDVFQQLDQTTTKEVQGLGLGLYIAKKVSNFMGGEIGVISEPGRGSNFWFTFAASKLENSGNATTKGKTGRSSIQNSNILLVEDKEINVLISRAILMELGCKVEVASNGFEAVQKCRDVNYDLILMDIQMPKMDGVEATRVIRSEHTNVPPIIALTAYAIEGDKEKYIGLGLDDYLPKPVTIDALKCVFLKWL